MTKQKARKMVFIKTRKKISETHFAMKRFLIQGNPRECEKKRSKNDDDFLYIY